MLLGVVQRSARARSLQLLAAISVACALAGLTCLACREEPKSGELIVAISTDMAIPDQIDTAWVQVQAHGGVVLATPYEVGSATAMKHSLPATLTLAVGEDPSQPVTIRVAGEKLGVWRTFREVVTTVPADRSALLRMPIQWLCDKSARTEMSTDNTGTTQGRMLSTCDEESTCMAGVCRPKVISSSDLPTYRPRDVWGGGSDPSRGKCFDTIACFDRARIATPDDACTVERPAGNQVNFALRVENGGICDSIASACFVPLDADSDEGWTTVPGSDRVRVTEGACNKLREGQASELYVSTQCEPKTAADPPCGTWSSVGMGRNAGVGIAGAGAPPPMAAPKATLVADLLARDSMAALCCPLMEGGGKLYSCLCRDKNEASIVSVDPAQGRPMPVGMVNPAGSRDKLRFAATVFEGSLYWQADQNLVRRTPLPGTDEVATSFPVTNGAVYENTSLVVSRAGVFVLASGVADAPGAPVQMLGIEPMKVRSFDTGATQPVFQFDHDDAALYLAVDIDEQDGARTRRTTRVVRMDMQTGYLSPVLDDQVLTIDDRRIGGYTGVQVDNGYLYALFEGATLPDGRTPVQIQRAELGKPGSMRVVYEVAIDRKKSQIGLLGAVEGSVLLTRMELDGTAVSRSSVIVVSDESDVPRVVADYSRDFPTLDLVRDDRQVYWINSSGRLFGLARTALQ